MAQGYGVEVSLTDKLVTGRLVSGKAVVVEALYRRLITPRGSLGSSVFPEDLIYGFDVSAYVGAVGYERAAATIGGMASNELSKDDRVQSVLCTATISEQTPGSLLLLLDIDGVLVDEGETFSLTLGVSDVSVELLAAS